jgi:WD40 repeat protein
LFVLGALGVAGAVWQDELIEWAQQYRAKPVEFTAQKEFEPGADQARVYRILPGDPPLLLTNTDHRDVVAVVWEVPSARPEGGASTGRRRATLKAPTESSVVLDPKVLQFRFKNDSLAVFSRDPLAKDRAGVWTYTLPDGETPTEVTPTFQRQPRRAWDVNAHQTFAVGEPRGTAIELWNVVKGTTVATLTAEGANFRAVAFTPDGQSVVGLCDESRLRVWDVYTGKLERTVRLAVRPAWEGSESGELTFDAEFTRVTITTDGRTGVWDVRNGAVIEPMKRLADGTPLGQKYRLRVETGGRGTFSVFHDDHTLRAAKLTVPGGGEVASWCLNDDRTLLAASSGRKVFLWRLKYPAP